LANTRQSAYLSPKVQPAGEKNVSACKRWLGHCCAQVLGNTKYSADEKIVFVNAWNEWAEGTHLEPDRKYGFGYLQATYDCVARHQAGQDQEEDRA